jgi:UDP-N-acetylmuramoyl-tripeptide--D-alanyl-D-alanine ligase
MELTIGEIKKLFSKNTLVLADDEKLKGVCKDTRTLKSGELYVAIQGENFDGHAFVEKAIDLGACAAVVSDASFKGDNLIYVDDTVNALGELAAYYRKKFSQPIIAITGSNGKTTTKELLTHVLKGSGEVLSTKGNLNNHIGVPLTISSFTHSAKFLVVELGMSHAGEIDYLTRLLQPDLALITNVGRAHLEGLHGDLEKVALAKGELFAALSASETAFINMEDERIAALPTKAKKVAYGFSEKADIWADAIEVKAGKMVFVLHHAGKSQAASFPMIGRHHVLNAVSVYAMAIHLGLAPDLILQRMASFQMKMHRGEIVRRGTITMIDDTYNANPDSMNKSLHALAEGYSGKGMVAVLGEMLELGENSQALHAEVGALVKELGCEALYAYGPQAKAYLEGFGYEGEEAGSHFFNDHTIMAEALNKKYRGKENTVMLFKGSRGMAMEKVLELIG